MDEENSVSLRDRSSYREYDTEDDDEIEEDEDEDAVTLKEQLISYINSNDVLEVERLLESGVSPSVTCFPCQITACHLAAFLGRVEILRLLVDKGASPKKPDCHRRTPLDLALWNGKAECVKLLLELIKRPKSTWSINTDRKNVYISEKSITNLQEIANVWFWSTPLHLASARAHSECVEIMLDAEQYDCNILDKNGCSALDICGEARMIDYELKIDNNEFERCVKILSGKVKPSAFPINNSTPLHKAVLLNNRSVTELFADVKAYRRSFDDSGNAPIHLAVINDKKNILIMLTRIKDDTVNLKNINGKTPLHLAVEIKWKRGVEILLNNGALIMEKSREGNNAIHLAALSDSSHILKNILDKLEDIKCLEERNDNQETPLIMALDSKEENQVGLLLDRRASLNILMKYGYNPLHIAVLKDKSRALKRLLDATRQFEEYRGILNGKCVLEKGGLSALHLAAEMNRSECFNMFLESGVNLCDRTLNSSFTPLHLAALNGHIKIVEVILERDLDLMDERDADNWKPFYRAVHKGHRDCVSLFLQHGADLSETLFYRNRKRTVIQLLVNCMPRSIDYLEKLFDSMITKNEYEINDENCKIEIDYSLLMPSYECDEERNYSEQMNVVVSLIESGRGTRKLLMHPYIESFVYIKWKSGLRYVYALTVVLYSLFLLSLTCNVYRTYSQTEALDWNWNKSLLSFFTGYLIIQESTLLVLLLSHRKFRSYLKRRAGITNWVLIILTITVMVTDHSRTDRDWPKILTGFTIFLAWLQVTVLMSNFPECGYTFQMFSTVSLRALKVLALFGIEVIFGFALAFWIMFDGGRAEIFFNPFDSFVRTFVMTSEFDYAALFEDVSKGNYRILVQIMFILFIFFVPIVMMNLIMALIISDTNDLKALGKGKRLEDQIRLIEILETVISFLTRSKTIGIKKISTIYPGKASWEAISLVSNNIEESLFERAKSSKSDP